MTTFPAIATMANFVPVQTMVSAIVANANVSPNGTCLAIRLVNAELPMRLVSHLMVNTLANSVQITENVSVANANVLKLRRVNIPGVSAKIVP